MAFPQIADADTKFGTVIANATSWTLTYPTNIVSGDLLVALVAADGTTSMAATGWEARVNNGGAVSTAVLFRVANGSETGTFTLTLGATEQGAWRIFRIPASTWFGGTVPTGGSLSTPQHSTGISVDGVGILVNANPNPPVLDPLNWATEDTLWIAMMSADTSRTVSVYPLAGRNTADVSGGAAGATLGVCTTESAVSSLDPGTFTISASDDNDAATIAIRPAAVDGGSTVYPRSNLYTQLLAN